MIVPIDSASCFHSNKGNLCCQTLVVCPYSLPKWKATSKKSRGQCIFSHAESMPRCGLANDRLLETTWRVIAFPAQPPYPPPSSSISVQKLSENGMSDVTAWRGGGVWSLIEGARSRRTANSRRIRWDLPQIPRKVAKGHFAPYTPSEFLNRLFVPVCCWTPFRDGGRKTFKVVMRSLWWIKPMTFESRVIVDSLDLSRRLESHGRAVDMKANKGCLCGNEVMATKDRLKK